MVIKERQSTHGLEQSETLTVAAQNLSKAKLYAERNKILYPEDTEEHEFGEQRIFTAQAAYDAAYKAYTNPFNVRKTL